MNFVDNLKSTQLRKLFKIFKSTKIKKFEYVWSRKGLPFEFASWRGVWNPEKIFNWAGPTCQWPVFTFDHPGPLPGPACASPMAGDHRSPRAQRCAPSNRPHVRQWRSLFHFPLLTLTLAHSLAHSPPLLLARSLLTRSLPAALRSPELLQHILPPSAKEVTRDAREPKPAPPLGPLPSTPPPLAFLRNGTTPSSSSWAPRRQGAPSWPLH
jgi:hypothetical protein